MPLEHQGYKNNAFGSRYFILRVIRDDKLARHELALVTSRTLREVCVGFKLVLKVLDEYRKTNRNLYQILVLLYIS